MIINPNNQNSIWNMPGMMKRGFNQTPDDIRNRVNDSYFVSKKEKIDMGKAPNNSKGLGLKNIPDSRSQISAMQRMERMNKNGFK